MKRFWDKVVVADSGCWLWIGSAHQGYGQIRLGGRASGRLYQAHRVAYEMLKGWIPEGLELDHLCRNPACVNPDHLEPVTHHINCLRGERATKTHCHREHPLSGDNLYITPSGRRNCKRCRADAERERQHRRSDDRGR